MHGSAQSDDRFPPASAEEASAGTDRHALAGAVNTNSDGSPVLEETELDSALQLLVERAQYITGATGTALALTRGEEMVCRASAGSSAPAVGARLQVRSGLTGESISRRQLLRCDNAESDPRVNLEACRALGIASIVVLPLLRRNGEIRGLFELFSDHAYAFEERDLVALERMAELTLTALDLAEQRRKSAPEPRLEPPKFDPEKTGESTMASGAPPASATPLGGPLLSETVTIPDRPEFTEPTVLPAEPPPVISLSAEPLATEPKPALTVPEAMFRVQKCASCGFPVSEGRTLCLDCERKDGQKENLDKKQREKEQREREKNQREAMQPEAQGERPSASEAPAPTPDEFVPAFLANSVPVRESWLANHVNVLAIAVLILGILVAVVVFR
jgi:putative methionine-R-sulfoxide reductase with GAF domain